MPFKPEIDLGRKPYLAKLYPNLDSNQKINHINNTKYKGIANVKAVNLNGFSIDFIMFNYQIPNQFITAEILSVKLILGY